MFIMLFTLKKSYKKIVKEEVFFILLKFYTLVVVNLIVYGAASPAVPVVSVTAFECMITV